jgi:hypothetical protein
VLTLPYVQPASFKAYPTFMPLTNLRPGDPVLADQDSALNNILLTASQWADDQCAMGTPGGSLSAHVQTDNVRLNLSRTGRISYHADHSPVTALLGLSLGTAPNALTPITDLTNLWIEDGAQIVGYPAGPGAPGMASLQFGRPITASEIFAQWKYVAGFVSTLLGATVAPGAASFTVTDPTGIVAGTVLRVWDPGVEEAVTVAPSYVVGSTTVPITTTFVYAHNPATSPISVASLPSTVRQSVMFYSMALLMRPDEGVGDSFPDSRVSPSIRADDSRRDGSGLVTEAIRLLQDYSRVR